MFVSSYYRLGFIESYLYSKLIDNLINFFSMKYSLFTSVFLMLLLASCQNDNSYYDECEIIAENCDFINGDVIPIDEAVSNLESITYDIPNE